MKLFEKIKNALFEEEEEEEQEEIAKKIDVDATINQEEKVKIRHYDEPEINDIKPVKETSPIIFDMDDFEEVEKEEVPKQEFTVPVYNEPVKEQKIIYGGYEKDVMKNERTKFKPSPIISPVYGILDHVEVTNDGFPHKVNPNIDIITDTKKTVSLDEVREKAFGNTREIKKLEEEDFNVKEEKEASETKNDNLNTLFGKLSPVEEPSHDDSNTITAIKPTQNSELTSKFDIDSLIKRIDAKIAEKEASMQKEGKTPKMLVSWKTLMAQVFTAALYAAT